MVGASGPRYPDNHANPMLLVLQPLLLGLGPSDLLSSGFWTRGPCSYLKSNSGSVNATHSAAAFQSGPGIAGFLLAFT